jgi:hypothetical protein
MSSNIERKFFALNVRRYGPQPSIFVRSFSAITTPDFFQAYLVTVELQRAVHLTRGQVNGVQFPIHGQFPFVVIRRSSTSNPFLEKVCKFRADLPEPLA